jgi:hypothetical protein
MSLLNRQILSILIPEPFWLIYHIVFLIVGYGNFKDFKDYKDGDISYNPNVPSYSANYQLNNDDYNVQQLRKRYDISLGLYEISTSL